MPKPYVNADGIKFEFIELDGKTVLKVSSPWRTELLVLAPSHEHQVRDNGALASTAIYQVLDPEVQKYVRDSDDLLTNITDYGHPVAFIQHFRDSKD